ncbi:MAG: hypothetical protein LAP38_08195 [Acidobacteriia bacterium]|nr:hypothetical protein [Terriglobia bacterium]
MTVLAVSLPIAALADISGTLTLASNARANLDTGATVSSGGDLLWSGTSLTPQANATAFNVPGGGGQSLYDSLTQSILAQFSALGNSQPIPGSALPVDAVVGVKTNGGNYAKLLVTANSGGSITFKFTTFGATGGGGGGGGGTPTPKVTAVENAATNIPPELPNAAVAQGALFVVKGSNLGPASLAIATAYPFTSSIGGASIKVTVGGTTVDAIMYYALAAQLAAILPSKTPTGTGTLTVTYNGQTSASAPITVVANNIGVFTLNSTGGGDAVATFNAPNPYVSPNNAPNPGEVVTLWATGLGPVTFDETNAAQQADMPNVPLKVFIGGQPANILFRGRNGCCTGVDTVYVTVPQGLSGCSNSVIMQIGNEISNSTSIPIATSGRACTPINGSTLPGSGPVSAGGITLQRYIQTTPTIGTFPGSTTKMDLATGSFVKITPGATPQQGSQLDVASYGSCIVSVQTSGSGNTGSSGTTQFLDAGASIGMAAPFGNRTLAKSTQSGTIFYQATLDNTATTLTAGTYTFTGPGGADVGPFTATYTMPQPLTWTNEASITTVNRAAGVTVTWSGGDPAGYVQITGSSTAYGATAADTASVTFICTARDSDGSFFVPPIVLLQLPATAPAPGSNIFIPGSLGISGTGGFAGFQASGINAGAIISIFLTYGTATYQ